MIRSARAAGLALGTAALGIAGTARAVDLPEPISFEVGPIGTLQVSGGADGYAYALTGEGDELEKGLLGTSTSLGFQFMNGLLKLEKPDGIIQFTFEAGAVNSLTLGARPKPPAVEKWSTGPVRTAVLTIEPVPEFSISAGQIGSLEGYESGVDWRNFNMLTTAIWDVENAQSVGVVATYAHGRISASVAFSDGFDTNRFNYLQFLASYAFNDTNKLSLFGATNLGSTGLDAGFYGNSRRSYSETTVGGAGVLNLVNSSMIGGYYSLDWRKFTIVPEFQYVWSDRNSRVGLTDYSSHFGAALFVNYKITGSDVSLGGWGEYFTSNGSQAWFLNPGTQGIGFAFGPTWSPAFAKKHFFARGDVGVLHLTRLGNPGAIGYGSTANGSDQATFAIELGILF